MEIVKITAFCYFPIYAIKTPVWHHVKKKIKNDSRRNPKGNYWVMYFVVENKQNVQFHFIETFLTFFIRKPFVSRFPNFPPTAVAYRCYEICVRPSCLCCFLVIFVRVARVRTEVLQKLSLHCTETIIKLQKKHLRYFSTIYIYTWQ